VRAGGVLASRDSGGEEGWFGFGEANRGSRRAKWKAICWLGGGKGEGNFFGTAENFGFETEAGAAPRVLVY